MIVQIYSGARRLLYGSIGRIEPAFVGFWLGVFGDGSLDQIDEELYNRSPVRLDSEYNRQGLFAWEEHVIHAHFGGARRVLLIGAGAGREMLALSRMGFSVDGFECNATLVHQANELLQSEGIPANTRLLQRDAVPEIRSKYEAAIIGWSVYTLIRGSARRVTFLRELRSIVAADAPLLISFFTRRSSAMDVRHERIKRVANVFRRALRRTPVDTGDDLVPNAVHYFTQAEAFEELRAGGFVPVEYRDAGAGRFDSGFAVGRASPDTSEAT